MSRISAILLDALELVKEQNLSQMGKCLQEEAAAASLDNLITTVHSCTGISVDAGLWFALLKELIWSWDLLPCREL